MRISKNLKSMVLLTLLLLLITLVFLYLHQMYQQAWMLSVYITFLTIFYHFAMRLFVGEAVTLFYKNRYFNVDSIGFRIYGFEPKLYRMLKVKQWKNKVITAKPEQFDISRGDPEELLHNMLQAELVHRIIMVLSFVPLLLIIPYGAPIVFVLTSIFACMIDVIFVIIQRYNRPRVTKLLNSISRKYS